MRFAAAGSSNSNTQLALQELGEQLRTQLDGQAPDLVFLFATPHHALEPGLGQMAREQTRARIVVGCTAESVAAGSHEFENGPALALWAGILPGCDIEPFHLKFERTPDGLLATGAPSAVEGAVTPRAAFLLGDPFSCAVDSMLAHFGEEFPNMPVLGGMASGASAPGENRLFLNEAEHDHGGVGVVIRGPVSIRTVVSQGCRPIGQPLVVTKSSRNVLQELGGKPALEQLNAIYRASPPEDQLLIQRKLHVGLAMSEYKEQFQRGDFLIANVIGADRDQGAVAVGNLVRTGQTVQFHVRDADTADEDLRSLLSQSLEGGQAAGGLLFSCNGRGTRMFPAPHHDASTIQSVAGGIPLAGFFAQGELGPVAGRNYIHGFTASVALFGPG
jgi:small ligand-binding sensory domain FIST